MFQAAVKLAMGFTRSVIISTRYDTGDVQCAIGTFVVLNSDGWILTCNHILDMMRQASTDAQEKADKDQKEAAIHSDPHLTPSQRRKQLGLLRLNRRLITNQSYWWSQDTAWLTEAHFSPLADLALVRLSGFDTSQIPNFPVFGNQATPIHPGASLCKLGFPFSTATASWDTAQGVFVLPDGTLPLPFFPLEGMYTRDCIFVDRSTNDTAKYFETSSPGLRGQSGGPTFDQAGVVWAIQARTLTLDVGFEAKFERNGRQVTEHQAMSVGLGASIEEIMKLINAHQVNIQVQP